MDPPLSSGITYAKATVKKKTVKRVSVKHLLYENLAQEPIIMLTMFGGKDRLGLDLTNFKGKEDEVVDTISNEITLDNASYSHSKKSNKMFIDFDCAVDAKNFKQKKIQFEGRQIILSETFELNNEIKNINIPSYEGKSFNKLISGIKENLLPHGKIMDMTVLVDSNGVKLNNNVKIIFKISPKKSIPAFLKVENAVFSLLYQDAPEVCNYCKSENHSINNCEKIKEKEQRILKRAGEEKKGRGKGGFDLSTFKLAEEKLIQDTNKRKKVANKLSTKHNLPAEKAGGLMYQLMGTQAPAGQDQVKLLTELVKQLLRKRENNQRSGDSYITTRIPVTDLLVYSELTKALPSFNKDFFKLPLTKEKRKMAIYSCSKTSSMNYNPPPLNNSAISATKKTDSALYGIQLALTQATRPIDYYVHRIIQKNSGLNTAEDSATLFASTMRALLADIAATVTQARIDNLHRVLDLPGKPTELIKTKIKPLIVQKALDALLAKKPTVNIQRARPFCRRQQYTISTDTYSSNTATAPSSSAATTEAGFNNRTSDRQANFCGRGLVQTNRKPMGLEHSIKGIHNFLQEPPLSRIDSDNTNSEVGGTCCKPKGLTAKKAETRSKQNFNRGPQACIRLEESEQICSRSELQNGNTVFNMPNDTTQGLHDRPTQRSEQEIERWSNDIEMLGKLYWKRSSNVNSFSSGTLHALTPIRVEEQQPKQIKLLDINCYANGACNIELATLEESTKIMGWPLFSPRDARNQNIHQCQQYSMGNSYNTTSLAYVKKFGETTFPKLLQIAEQIWSHCLRINTCPQTHCSDRMVVIRPSICNSEQDIWTSRHRPVCINREQEGRNLPQLVSGQQSSRLEFNGIQLVQVKKSIRLPSIKLNIADNSESLTGTTDDNVSNTNVEISNLVSGCNRSIDVPTYTPPGNDSGTRPPKRKIFAPQEQALVIDGLENQRRTSKNKIIVSNKRCLKCRSRYSATQQRFFNWRTSYRITSAISAPLIVNYLAESYKKNKIKSSPVRAYKSALMMLVYSLKELKNSQLLEDFFAALDDSSLTSFVRPHSDTVLCPVNTYEVYKQRIDSNPCHTPHTNNTKYPYTKDPRNWCTLAASSGVFSDDIVFYAFWSNYTIFDSYYQLSRDSTNSLTESILPLK
ncbi:hypothetical protein BB561_002226 [Smittium simulii]|uniref:Uncharacterized protein n=1 Tax=Smittium simulii TaxID=133385 RepID=A0A2T9YRG4_9FUNG|nr:hypothetical protein BB561_002226 [Smittium simulii]